MQIIEKYIRIDKQTNITIQKWEDEEQYTVNGFLKGKLCFHKEVSTNNELYNKMFSLENGEALNKDIVCYKVTTENIDLDDY